MSVRLPQPLPGVVISFSLLVAIFAAGCDRPAAEKKPPAGPLQGESHKHADGESHAGEQHGAPETFAEGVRELKEKHLQIKQAFEQADTQKALELAHGPLHGVGGILEALPELAKQAELPPEAMRIVDQSVEALFDGYGSVDEAIHAGKEPDYAAVAAQIDEAMASLEAVRTPPAQ